jgi:hypothetical protein
MQAKAQMARETQAHFPMSWGENESVIGGNDGGAVHKGGHPSNLRKLHGPRGKCSPQLAAWRIEDGVLISHSTIGNRGGVKNVRSPRQARQTQPHYASYGAMGPPRSGAIYRFIAIVFLLICREMKRLGSARPPVLPAAQICFCFSLSPQAPL